MQVKQVGALFAQYYGSFVFSFVEDENSLMKSTHEYQ